MPKPGYCRCGKPDEDCPICLKCENGHASCLPCKSGRKTSSSDPRRQESAAASDFRPVDEPCACRHLAGVHSLAGQCLVVRADATGKKLLLPPGPAPGGVTRCTCTGFAPLTAAPTVPPADAPEIEDDAEDAEFADEDETDVLA